MEKPLHTLQSLLIVLDLCQPHYQNLFIIYLKFIAKNLDVKTVSLSLSLKGLKITKFLRTAKSVQKINTKKWINEKVSKYIQGLQ